MDNPDQFEELRRNSELSATTDVTLGGQDVREGDRVVFWHPSGNRDENVFADPFRFDIHRSPNPHVAFGGGGVHYCLGANLAHKEIQVVLRSTAAGYDIELTGLPVWTGAGPVHNVGISIDSLPVRITARH